MHPYHELMLRPLHPHFEMVRREQGRPHRDRDVTATGRRAPASETVRRSRRRLPLAVSVGAAGLLAAVFLVANLGST